ncbi:MAG: hypothetical protein IKA02_02030 [Clostridia bacterium]|nr:hypothetical protein [Clostridia bacterium]
MKKSILFILTILVLVCAFTVCISAEEVTPVTSTYYVVQSYNSVVANQLQSEGKNIVEVEDLMASDSKTMGVLFNNVANGDHVELILAENIYTSRNSNMGILINRAITVTVKYNGFVHVCGDHNNNSGFFLSNKYAFLRVIGTNGIDEEGVVSEKFVAPTFIDNQIIIEGNVDAYHGNNYIFVNDGSVYMENMRMYSDSGACLASTEGSEYDVNDRYILKDCALTSNGYALSLQGGGRSRKIIQIDNCYVGTKIYTYTVVDGSYVKNTTIFGGVHMDCWDVTNQLFEFENSVIDGPITTATGRTKFKFTDCTFDPSQLGLGSDGGGGCSLQAYTTETCTQAGSKITYGVNDKTGKVDSAYTDEHPALGHNASVDTSVGIQYDSFLEEGITSKCLNCGIPMADENLKADPLFIFLGYSVPEDGSYGIVVSFIVNVKAVEQYENATGKVLNYGMVAVAKDNLGNKNPLDKDGNVVTLEKGSVVKAEISREYCSYDFVLTGMNENHVDLNFVFATYVTVTKDGETEVVYLQNSQKTDTLNAVSYNSICNL